MDYKLKRALRLFLILLSLLLSIGFVHGENIVAAGFVPSLVITKTGDFKPKIQFSVRNELLSDISLPGLLKGEPFIRMTGGLRWTAPSSLEGGFSYNGFTGAFGGILFGFSPVKAKNKKLAFKTAGGILGEWARYRNTSNYFFFPTLRLEGSIDYELNPLSGNKYRLNLRAGIPLEWSLRRDTGISLAAGLFIGSSISFRRNHD